MGYIGAGLFLAGLVLLVWASWGCWPKKEKAQEMEEVLENGRRVWRSVEEAKPEKEKKVNLRV